MIIFQSPVPGPYTASTVVLDGLSYTFEFRWSFRYERFTLNIYDVQGELIAAGIKLVAGDNLLTPFSNVGLPPGKLRVVQQPTQDPPSLETLGVSAWLVYYGVADVAAVDAFEESLSPDATIAEIV